MKFLDNIEVGKEYDGRRNNKSRQIYEDDVRNVIMPVVLVSMPVNTATRLDLAIFASI